MQFPRHICNHHPTETITNFCEEETCLLPLCPSCIPIHLSNHPKCSSNPNGLPQIENISTTFSRTLKSLTNYQQQFNERKEQIKSLQVQHNSIKSTLEEGLSALRREIQRLVDDWFQEVRVKYQEEIEEVLRKNDKSEFRLEVFEQEVEEKVREISERVQNFRNSHEFDMKVMVESMSSERNRGYLEDLEAIKNEIEEHMVLQERVRFNKENTEMMKKIPEEFVRLLQSCISINGNGDNMSSNKQLMMDTNEDRVKEDAVESGGRTTNSSFSSQLQQNSTINQLQQRYNNLKLKTQENLKENYSNLPYQIKEKNLYQHPQLSRQRERITYTPFQQKQPQVNHDEFYQQIVQRGRTPGRSPAQGYPTRFY